MSERPKVLIIGDSISIGYTPVVAEALGEAFVVAHQEGNSGDSRNALDRLDAWLAADADAALVHFNVGLHDLRHWHDARGYQVPLERYRANVTELVARLKDSGKTIIWATTTPVVDERVAASVPDFTRQNDDVQAYNAAAAEIVAASGIPTNDLHAVIANNDPEVLICPDGTHMTEAGYRLLGLAVADAVRRRAAT